jgi:hypothetical protein
MIQLDITHTKLNNTCMLSNMNKLASKSTLQCTQLHHLQCGMACHDLPFGNGKKKNPFINVDTIPTNKKSFSV